MPPDSPSYAGHRILLQSDFKLDPPLMTSLHLKAQCFMSASCPFLALTNIGNSSFGPDRYFGKPGELELTQYCLPANGTAV